MPNFVTNVVTLQGIGSDNRFYTIDEDTKHFDFNKIIPEPTTADECVAKYGTGYLDSVDEEGHSLKRLDHSDDRPWFDWYNWHRDFWGTKWNAFGTGIIDDNTIQFQTAWGAPDPIFGALSRMFPDIELRVHSEYEGDGSVDSVYLNGKVVSSVMSEEQM